MFFIAGTKGTTTTVATGEFYCSECDTRREFHHNQVHEKATVFFIPVLKLALLGEYIECQSCGNTYEMEILDYDSGQKQLKAEALYLRGIRKVMTMMMLADGTIENSEKTMMRAIYKNLAHAELSDHEIDAEIGSCIEKPTDLEEYLNELFPQLNEHGREVIIKAAYSVIVADGDIDDEIKLLTKLAKYFQISKAHLNGIIAEMNEPVEGER